MHDHNEVPPTTRPPAAAPMRILVVDDEPDVRNFIQDVLEEAGYHVVTADDGQQGLERVLERPPDLVLTDLMMPHLGGDGLVAALRLQPDLAALPIVIMSAGYRTLPVPGITSFLAKPFNIDTLLALMQQLLH